jgi:hypothetical protein
VPRGTDSRGSPLGDFDSYLARGDVDLPRDQVSYRLAAGWLDDAEFAELRRELARVLQPRLACPPAPGRTRRILARILLPGDEAVRDQPSERQGDNRIP